MSRSRLRNKFIRSKWIGHLIFASKANDPVRNVHRQDEVPKNKPSRYITQRIGFSKVAWLQESTSFGGHSIPQGGHRMVSGIVRAKVREEVRMEIEENIMENDSALMSR